MSTFNASARPFVSSNNNQQQQQQQYITHSSPLPSPSSHLNTGAPIYHPSPRSREPYSTTPSSSYGNQSSSGGYSGSGNTGGGGGMSNGGWGAPHPGSGLPSPDMGHRSSGTSGGNMGGGGGGNRRPPHRSDSAGSMQQIIGHDGWPQRSPGSGGSSPATFRPQVLGNSRDGRDGRGMGGGGGGGNDMAMAKRTVGPIDRSGNNTPVGPKRGPPGGFMGATDRERGGNMSSTMMGGSGGRDGSAPNRSHNSSPRPPQSRKSNNGNMMGGGGGMNMNMNMSMNMGRDNRMNDNRNDGRMNDRGMQIDRDRDGQMMLPSGGPLMINATSTGSSGNSNGAPMGSPKTAMMAIANNVTLSKDATTDERHTFYMYEFR
jgi:hypothetical protein